MRESPDERSPGDVAPEEPRPEPQPAFRVFLEELKRRHVYQVAAAYAVAAGAVIQLGPTVLDALDLPRVATRILVLATIAGFPVALVLAWLFQLATSVRREPRLVGPAALRAARLARLALVVVVLLAGAVGGAALWQLRGQAGASADDPASQATAASAKRVAVLYFDNLSPQPGDSLGTLLTENVIAELKSAAPSLTVLSADAVRRFRSSGAATDSLARVLGVGTLITGDVVRSGGRVRLRVSLASGTNGEVLDQTTVERPDGELISLTDNLAKDAVLFLRRRLGAAIRLQEWRATAKSEKAWELVAQAQRVANDAAALAEAGEDSTEAVVVVREDSLLAAAERADSHWTVPTVQRGWLDYNWGPVYYRTSRPQEIEPAMLRAVAHADRVLTRLPDDAGALELRGNARRYLWQYARPPQPEKAALLRAAAERDLTRAVELDPTRDKAWKGLSVLRFEAGDYAGAESAASRSFEEDAYAEDAGDLVWRGFESAFQLGREERARFWCNELARRNPGQVIGIQCALKLAAWGREKPNVDSAWALVRRVESAAPNSDFRNMPVAQIAMAGVLARAGLRDSARAVLARAPLGAPDLLYPEAEVRVLLGENSRAVELLLRFLSAYPASATSISRNRCFSHLLLDPRLRRAIG